MKLTGKLKEKVEKAETKEQAKEMIASAGMELTDEEMEEVAGGCGMVEYAITLCLSDPIASQEYRNMTFGLKENQGIQNLYKYKDLTES